jgi:hypothetical protein
MCIRVQFSPRRSIEDPWDRDRNQVTLPDHLDDDFALRALRALLGQLDVEQDRFGARCWCGEPIELLPRIPEQRRSGQVMTHGA